MKADFRLARRSTTIGGVDIAAGTPVMLLNGAANRDPRRFECPDEFRIDRPNAQDHMAFGRGVHSCPGGPLARAEGRVSLERILDRTRDIRLAEEHHGPPAARRFTYEPTWVLRGLSELHLEFTPVGGAAGEPRRRRHRWRVGHRARRRPSAGGGRALGRRPRPQRPAADGGGRPTCEPRAPEPWPSKSTSPTGRRSTSAFAQVRAELGPVEILVTSAGIESFDPLLDISPENWDRIIAVNLTGTFGCVQAAVPDMLAAGWGRIVTISSSSAQSGAPNMTHYAASKGGVIALTKALAVELARSGITANTIPPSLVDTPMARAAEAAGDFPGVDVVGPMVPLGRAGTPADIAAACSFLCSDGGSYITGQVIGVNGGMYI